MENRYCLLIVLSLSLGLFSVFVGSGSLVPDPYYFDIEPFLDPEVNEAMSLPLPVYKGENIPGISKIDKRQLSLAPTTAYITRRSINTACAFTIPLFTFVLPNQVEEGTPAFIGNQVRLKDDNHLK